MTENNTEVDWGYAEVAAFRCESCGNEVAVEADIGELGGVRCINCDQQMERFATR